MAEYQALDGLQLWAGNYREGDVGAIVNSVLKFGYNWPVAVDSAGVVRAGNHRVKALRELQRQGWQPEGACIRANGNGWEVLTVNLEHLTEQQQLAFAIADNRTSELASNDEETLLTYLQELAAEDEKLLQATGYDGDDIDALLRELNPVQGADDPGAQVDRAAELQAKWGTERGQLWTIASATADGSHRILCGDSTDAGDVARLMGGVKADAVVTDVPYGIAQVGGGLRDIDYGDWDKGDVLNVALGALRECLNSDSITAFCRSTQISHILELFVENRMTFRTLAWVKKNPTVMNGQHLFLPGLELAAFGRAKKAWFGGHCVSSVWDGSPPHGRDHPTQKPLELIEWVISLTCMPMGKCYDPFLGSGTTLVACEQTGRIGYGMEIDPGYVAVSLERLAGMGLTPQLEVKVDNG